MRKFIAASAVVSMAVLASSPAFAAPAPRLNGGGTTAEGAQFSVSARPEHAGPTQDPGHFNYTDGDFKVRQCNILTYEDNPRFEGSGDEQFPGAEGAVRITAECRLIVPGGGVDNDRTVFVKAKFADYGEPGGGVDRARIQIAETLAEATDGDLSNNLVTDFGRIQAGNIQIIAA